MSTNVTLAYDNFDTPNAGATEQWHVISEPISTTGALVNNADGQAETDILGNGGTVTALYTGHANGSTVSNYIGRRQVQVTRPTVNTGTVPYMEWGLTFGWLDPDDWAAHALYDSDAILGWSFLYNSNLDIAFLRASKADNTTENLPAFAFTDAGNDIYTGDPWWQPGATHTMRVDVINEAITDPYEPYYGTATAGQPQQLRAQFYIDDFNVGSWLLPYAPSLITGDFKARGFPAGGTCEGLTAAYFVSADTTDPIKFDNFIKTATTGQHEPEPSCVPDPTLTAIAITGEITGGTATHVLTDTTIYPDFSMNDSREWFTNEVELEAGYKTSWPKLTQSRRTIDVSWTNRSTTDKDLLLTGYFSTGASDTVLQWTPPDEAGTLYWAPVDHSLGISMVAPGVFTLSATLLEVRL